MVKISIYLIRNKIEVEHLTGTYGCKVDAKGRLMVPAPLKKQLSSVLQEGFVLKRAVFQPCLELYPMKQWNLLMEKMNELNKFKRRNVDFIRKFTAGVKIVEVDTNGRLLIPKDLIRIADIKKEIMLSSVLTVIEIWDKQNYEKAIAVDDEEFADLAEEIMGNDEGNEIS